MLGLRFCARAFSCCGKRGPLFIAVRGPLTIVASLVAEHRLQMHRLSSCGSRAQLLRGTWDLPRPGLEPVPPALAGRFSTTAPPGKPLGGDIDAGQTINSFLWFPMNPVKRSHNRQSSPSVIWYFLSFILFCFCRGAGVGKMKQKSEMSHILCL